MRLLSLLLVAHQKLKEDSITEENTHIVIGHGEIKLVLTRKLPHRQLVFIILKDAMYTGRSHQPFYPTVNPVNCTNDWGGKIVPYVQLWHGCYKVPWLVLCDFDTS